MSEGTLQEKGFVSYLPIVITCVIFAFVPAAMQASCMGIFYPPWSRTTASRPRR